MHKIVMMWLLGCSFVSASQTLLMFLEAAHQSETVLIQELQERAADERHSAAQRSYLPRIELFGNAALLDERGSIDAGESYSGGAKASLLLFDGFGREHTMDELRFHHAAAGAQTQGSRKALSLEVAQHYFDLLSLRGDIAAQEHSRQKLSQELGRQKHFLEARLSSEEAYERLRAALADADYTLHDLRYEEKRLIAALRTLSGLEAQALQNAHLELPQVLEVREIDTLKALRYRSNAAQSAAKRALSTYYPTLFVEDSYTYYRYENDSSAFPIERVEQQNRLMFQANMTLFDFFSASHTHEALMCDKYALDAQIAYEARSAATDVALSKANIERTNAMIEAAKTALGASQRTFETIERKYHANLVDYVTYLDALSALTRAKAHMVRAQHALQMAHALYIYYSGFDLKEYVR